jgi:hypothetical protein
MSTLFKSLWNDTGLPIASPSVVFTAFAQYFEHGLNFTNNDSALLNLSQTYGKQTLVGEFLRESDGSGGLSSRLLMMAADPELPLLPTLRELVLYHVGAGTVFSNGQTLQQTLPGLINADGMVNTSVAYDFLGTVLFDQFVTGGNRADNNSELTEIQTIWARNHNFHVESLEAAGFAGTPEELFQIARMLNEADYQRVVFVEFATAISGDEFAEEFGRMREATNFSYIDSMENADLYDDHLNQDGFSSIVGRNTGLTELPGDIFTLGRDGILNEVRGDAGGDANTDSGTVESGSIDGDGNDGGEIQGADGAFGAPPSLIAYDPAAEDSFEFHAPITKHDFIDDFKVGDRIDVSNFVAGTVTLVNGHAGAPGEIGFSLELVDGEEFTVLRGNLDSDANEEFTILIRGHHNLTGSNFV